MPDIERQRLTRLIGRQLKTVATDRWCVQLVTDQFAIDIVPEEHPTPDDFHPGATVTRPMIISPSTGEIESMALELGTVQTATILSTVIQYSVPSAGQPIQVNGVTIEGGMDYFPIYSHPLKSPNMPVTGAIANLDIGFVLHTHLGNRVTVYTDGFSFFASVAVNEDPFAPEICLQVPLTMQIP